MVVQKSSIQICYIYIYIYIYISSVKYVTYQLQIHFLITKTYKVISSSRTFPLSRHLYIIYTFFPSPTYFSYLYMFSFYLLKPISLYLWWKIFNYHYMLVFDIYYQRYLSLSLSLSHLDFSIILIFYLF